MTASKLTSARLKLSALAKELGRPEYLDRFQGILARMSEGEFRIISARRAFTLMRDRIFE